MDLQILYFGKIAIAVRGTRGLATSSLVGTHSRVTATQLGEQREKPAVGRTTATFGEKVTGLGLCHEGRHQLGERLETPAVGRTGANQEELWELFVGSRELSRLGVSLLGTVARGLTRPDTGTNCGCVS